MGKIKYWLKAARLRTLPLAFSSILLGSFLAYVSGTYNWSITFLAILTTLFLQVLSNFANDYGDAISGVDNNDRVGPARSIQSGELTKKEMVGGIILFSFLSLISGVFLVLKGTTDLVFNYLIFFILLGFIAIGSAIKYTVGKKPYGYMGFGDLFVFIFFGIVGVSGTYFLHTQQFPFEILLPATSVGLFSVGVLNLNNMRDLEQDKKVGKITIAVRLGKSKAKIYHNVLISTALITSITYTLFNFLSILQLLFIITLPLFILNLIAVNKNEKPNLLDPHLKKLAISTFLFVVTFGIGLILSYV